MYALYCQYQRNILIGVTLLLVFIGSPMQKVDAATFAVVPSTGTAAIGSTMNVIVSAATDATAVHAVSGTLLFPSNLLEVVSISKSQSLVSTWVKEPASTAAGTIQFEGMIPDPGFVGTDGRVLMVTFKVKAIGTARVSFATSSILANDGDGTEIIAGTTGAVYTLTPPVAVGISSSTATTSVSGAAGGASTVPQVTSLTHQDGVWSRQATGTFSFVMASSVTALRLLVDDKPKSVPTVTYAPPITTRDIKDLPEGVSYLHVQFKTAAGWGPVIHYTLQIDTTAPTSFNVTEVSPGTFSFLSNDALSGIVHYAIQIDGGDAQTYVDTGSHTYTVGQLAPGMHTLLVRAVDAAGNSTESTRVFTTVAPVVAPTAQPIPAAASSDSLVVQNGTFIVAVLSVVTPCVAMVILLGWLIYAALRALGTSQRKIAREVAEAKLQVQQSCFALREEYEAHSALLRKARLKRKLTREESKILKRLEATRKTMESLFAYEQHETDPTL